LQFDFILLVLLVLNLQTISRDSALIVKTKEQIRIKKVKLGIAKNEVTLAAHSASRWARKGQDFSSEAGRVDARIKVRTSQVDSDAARLKNEIVEKQGLVKLLQQINAKLRSYAQTHFSLSCFSFCHIFFDKF
jgi:hypothetical protein